MQTYHFMFRDRGGDIAGSIIFDCRDDEQALKRAVFICVESPEAPRGAELWCGDRLVRAITTI
jgi:hypothetical protein